MPTTPEQDLQKILLEFLKRRHPEYEEMLAHWDFLEATYRGGRAWFEENLFRYHKEGDGEYQDRVKRAYRFNHTREVTDLVQKYIFKSPVTRGVDAPEEIKRFWENATLSGLDINQFMKLGSTMSSVLGMPWIFTDSTKSEEAISLADEKKNKARVYAYLVKPQDVLDIGFDEQGACIWVLVRETVRDDKDPIFSSGGIYELFRLWTREDWKLFQIIEKQTGSKKEAIVEIVDTGVNPIGEIPGFPLPHVIGENKYSAPALINDIAYLDRAVGNYLSNLDAIIQDQTFSQLAIPAQALLPGEDNYKKVLEMGTKRAFVYDGADGAKPEYLSPDPKQANMIVVVINKIINEIYHTIGMAGERTKQDNAVGIDNSSGVAKAYDFERMNSLLTSKADSLENAENKLVRLVMLWHKKAAPEEELVKYPDTFDVRTLFDEFTVAEKLALIEAPDMVRQEQMKQVVEKLFPRLSKDLRKAFEDELKNWPPAADPNLGGAGNKFPSSTKKPIPAKENRQGQVTK